MFHCSRQGTVDVIRGQEPIHLSTLDTLMETLAPCLERAPPRIVFDLQATPLLDSRGMEFLLDARERSLHRGGVLKLAAPNPLCQDILRATGVGERFEVFEDVKSAVGSFLQ